MLKQRWCIKTNKQRDKSLKSYDVNLDEEEQDLLRSYEKGEWKSVENLASEKKLAQEIAANTLRKNARITLRISDADLARLKEKAAYKGLPYQTFISSVLHEYAAGHFET